MSTIHHVLSEYSTSRLLTNTACCSAASLVKEVSSSSVLLFALPENALALLYLPPRLLRLLVFDTDGAAALEGLDFLADDLRVVTAMITQIKSIAIGRKSESESS